MLDHIGIEVSDYPLSKAFYEAALAPLGISLLMEFAESAAGFGSETEIGPKAYSGRDYPGSTPAAALCHKRSLGDFVAWPATTTTALSAAAGTGRRRRRAGRPR